MKRALLASLSSLLSGTGLVLAAGDGPAPDATPAGPRVVRVSRGSEPDEAPAGAKVAPVRSAPTTVSGAAPAAQLPDRLPNQLTGLVRARFRQACQVCTPPAGKAEGHPDAGTSCQACAPPCGPRVWARADYLLWWLKGARTPPLFTTGSPAAANPGALGQAGTAVLFGGNIDLEARSGGRFEAGLWLDDDHRLGVEGGYFFLGRRSVIFNTASSGVAVLGRPFFDVTPGSPFEGSENVDLLAFPGIAAGTAGATLTTRLQGAEVNLASEFSPGESSVRIKFLAGTRYLRLDETLGLRETTAFLPAFPVFGGNSIASSSEFATRNRFYGGQFGSEVEADWGRLMLKVRGTLGLGSTRQEVVINGTTTTITPVGITSTIAGGPFALPSNMGSYRRDRFALVPELRADLGFRLTDALRLYVGYTFLAWTHVARPGDQIDRAENISQIPPPLGPGALTGPARPALTFKDTTFWAQGLDFGAEFQY